MNKGIKRFNKIKGNWGEEKACRYLENNGFSIVARNFRSKQGEIDIIAEKYPLLVFAEVKTRTSTKYGVPKEAVTYTKQRRFRYTAEFFLLTHAAYRQYQPRMDVVEILTVSGEAFVRHTENCF